MHCIVKRVSEAHDTICAYCDAPIEGEPRYRIHRDGPGEGPEVPLWDAQGAHEEPSLRRIWDRIAPEGWLAEFIDT